MPKRENDQRPDDELNEPVQDEVQSEVENEAPDTGDEVSTEDDLIETVLNLKLPAVGPKVAMKVGAANRPSGVAREVLGLFRSEGIKLNPIEIITALMMLADLIQTVGPKVREIFDLIRKALGK